MGTARPPLLPRALLACLAGALALGGSALVVSTATVSAAAIPPGWHATSGSLPDWTGAARNGPQGDHVGLSCTSAVLCTGVTTANPTNSAADPSQFTAGTIYTTNGGTSWSGSFDNSVSNTGNLDPVPNSIQCTGAATADCSALGTVDNAGHVSS